MPNSDRFLTLDELADELNISRAQAYALVRRQHVPAVKIGGRGQWRIERSKLEEYLERTYGETSRWLTAHPFTGGDPHDEPS